MPTNKNPAEPSYEVRDEVIRRSMMVVVLGGREGAREGARKGGREGGRDGGREGAREGGREEVGERAREERFLLLSFLFLSSFSCLFFSAGLCIL